jgi:hypothetical protein
MEILYSDSGFEQDNAPQLCLEGTLQEYKDFVKIIYSFLKENKEGEIVISFLNNNKKYRLSFFCKKGDKILMKRINDTDFIVSLDHQYWAVICTLLEPLGKERGYQFIEFEKEMLEDVGFICRSK